MQHDTDAPVASIIVLFLRGSPWIDRCVRSLLRHAPASVRHEVILMGNGVDESDPAAASVHAGVTVLTSRANLGFGGGCNWAGRHARGRYLVLLNDDAIIRPGWLEGLVEAADRDARLGAVASLVLRPDGQVDEAGRVMWRDGVSHGIGAGHRESTFASTEPYSVDCASACSMLVRREAWEAVGGFDDRFHPAYYEDADLCLELRRRGWRVACAPASRVVHERSASTTLSWRRFLGLRNHRLFVDKWASELESFPERPGDRPSGRAIASAARGAEVRARDAYHGAAMERDPPKRRHQSVENAVTDERATLLELEVARLIDELRLKDEYIVQLTTPAVAHTKALERVLAAERRRARVAEMASRIPMLRAIVHRARDIRRAARAKR